MELSADAKNRETAVHFAVELFIEIDNTIDKTNVQQLQLIRDQLTVTINTLFTLLKNTNVETRTEFIKILDETNPPNFYEHFRNHGVIIDRETFDIFINNLFGQFIAYITPQDLSRQFARAKKLNGGKKSKRKINKKLKESKNQTRKNLVIRRYNNSKRRC
jgi:hypothetical protein